MNIIDVRNDIISKDIKNLYIFYGEEYLVLREYINKIRSLFDNVFSIDNFAILKNKLMSNSLFKNGKELYIIRDDKDFISNENYWKDLISRLKKRDTCIIFKYDSLDQRTKFFKNFSDSIVEFSKLSESVLKKYIKRDIDVSDSCCDYLISICKNDCSRILLETNKVRNLSDRLNISDYEAFKMCYTSGVFYEEPEDEVFDLINSILSKDTNSIYASLYDSKRRNDNPILILSILHTNIKALLQVKCFEGKKDIVESTGLTSFQIKNAMKYVDKYTKNDLVRFIKYINYCSNNIRNGSISSDMIIDFLLINVL